MHVIKKLNVVRMGHSRISVRHYARRDILMPALSPTMTEGTISKWLLKEGDIVKAGDAIAEVNTDKAVVPLEIQEPGYLAKILVKDKTQTTTVGTLIAVMVDKKEELTTLDFSRTSSTVPPPSTPPTPKLEKQATSSKSTSESSNRPKLNFPHTPLLMPSLSPTMEEGRIAEWLVKPGDSFKPGDALANVETDKAVVPLETQEAGVMGKILAMPRERSIKVGEWIAVLVEKKEDVPKLKDFIAPASGENPIDTVTVTGSTNSLIGSVAPNVTTGTGHDGTVTNDNGRVVASPLAKVLAAQKGICLADISPGSGPHGRIIKADVEEFQPRPKAAEQVAATTSARPTAATTPLFTSTASAYEDIPVSQIRKITAARLLESKSTIPHYYLSIECQMDELMKVRQHLNNTAGRRGGFRLSINDFIVKAAAKALQKVPTVNSSWQNSFIRQYNTVDINVAVQTENGLLTPIVFDALHKGLKEISTDITSLAIKAKAGKLQPKEFIGGTFTVSNLGMYGVKEFSAIINPPQAAILAVGTTYKTVVEKSAVAVGGADKSSVSSQTSAGFAVVENMMVTLSLDHRVVDGAVGAQWLQSFKEHIEDPVLLMV